MSQIYFIRHGQASVFSDNYDQLSELGEKQSFITGKYLAEKLSDCHRIYLSSLKRHQQTKDHFIEGWNSTGKSMDGEIVMMNELEEHHGYRAVKSIIPELLMNNKELQELASKPFKNKEEQIKNYFHIYAKVSMMWVKEELNGLSANHESWSDFLSRSSTALQQIKKDTRNSEKIVVITSGGPIACGIAVALDLSPVKTLEVTWSIHNCSISKFLYDTTRFSLSHFNSTHHFENTDLVTLV